MDTSTDTLDGEMPALIGGGRLATPELRLARAVLEDALRIVLEDAPGGRRARALRDDARRWVFDDDLGWPLSFHNVCRDLLVDGALLRRRIRAHEARRRMLDEAA